MGSQDKLLEITDEMDARLEYFQELDHATRMLNHPGESLVLQTDFLYMVERVDVCIDYLKAHVRDFAFCQNYLSSPFCSAITVKPRSTFSDISNA